MSLAGSQRAYPGPEVPQDVSSTRRLTRVRELSRFVGILFVFQYRDRQHGRRLAVIGGVGGKDIGPKRQQGKRMIEEPGRVDKWMVWVVSVFDMI